MIVAGIVTFNPDIVRLKENVENIFKQVDKLIIVDNNSSNFLQIKKLLELFNTEYIRLEKNFGIAYALNCIGDYAIKNGYSYFLTLDQDSIVSFDLIECYKRYLNLPDVAQLTCIIKDRNFDIKLQNNSTEYAAVDFCITSGSLVVTDIYERIGKFDAQMFIDRVDFEYSIRIKKRGYKIYKINFCGLLHEVGQARSFFNGKVVLFNHSPSRRYYATRNGIYIARKYGMYNRSFKYYFKELYQILIVFLFEDRKIKKLKASIKGVKDGFNMKVSKYE